jgi:RimJ/RimL family protein N-acetyltransferase
MSTDYYNAYTLNSGGIPPPVYSRLREDLIVKAWKPSIFKWMDGASSIDNFGLFKNWVTCLPRWFAGEGFGFTVLTVSDTSGRAIGQCVLFERSWKFSFMGDADSQIGMVLILPEFRSLGYGKLLILEALSSLKTRKTIWWLCKPENIASNRLATSLGFNLRGVVIRRSFLGFIPIYTIPR